VSGVANERLADDRLRSNGLPTSLTSDGYNRCRITLSDYRVYNDRSLQHS
jgi:hypothetical protein